MELMIRIAKETTGLTGYTTYKVIETLRRDDALRKLESMKVKRRFTSPFNSSIEIVVVE